MGSMWGIIIGLAVGLPALVVGGVLLARRWRATAREALLLRQRQEFRQRREWLEAEFIKLASASGKPRGLAWVDCVFSDEVAYARDRQTGGLRALVGVTISFEAIEGGGMEEVEAVSNLRAATAVFHHHGQAWTTEGRAVFNLNPSETILHFQNDLETVD